MDSRKHNRREFLGKATLGIAATTVGVPRLEQAAPVPSPAPAAGEAPYRTLGRSGEKVSLVGLGGSTSAFKKTKEKAFASFEPQSIMASTSLIIVGTIMAARVKCAWARPCGMVTGRKSF